MRLLRAELAKLLFAKRTFVGWVGLLAVPVLITLALYLSRNQHHPDNGPGGFVSLARHNGMLVPVAAIAVLSAFLLPLLGAMAGSYQLAGEAESGTIKTWLLHPVNRGSVLLSKWTAALIYMGVGLLLVAAGGYVAGGAAFGLHAPTLVSGGTVSTAHGIALTALAYALVLVGTLCVVSLAFLFATFTNSSLTAAIAALVVFIVMNVVGAFSYFDFLKPYLFTSHMDAWQNLFSRPIVWHPIETALLTFVIYIVALTVAAWYVFRRKDILV
jgi:ABC-2 type transport system permease protein